MNRLRFIAAALVTCGCACAQSARAADKAPEAKETIVLQRAPVLQTDRELGMGIAEFPPNASKPRHKATGPELCYVLEGEVTVQIDGKAAHVYRAGESFPLPANLVHITKAGPSGAKVLASWVHTPGKPFNVPAPD
ncbi:cupin domain-containing protein [Paraburkholderia hospita]|jgi:quercetin dioxygenase-like cupin family protein|uniref:cupin domain-containing protein n=1 Tax=Paraburkholderia hospita TaxID=169430 RepID=UPI000DEFB7BB|nr:cupin domain-containing protein [Paraburkholderia hospita]AXE98360.1 cupin domain-containing protein [Paraburkholderia hospita]